MRNSMETAFPPTSELTRKRMDGFFVSTAAGAATAGGKTVRPPEPLQIGPRRAQLFQFLAGGGTRLLQERMVAAGQFHQVVNQHAQRPVFGFHVATCALPSCVQTM